MGRKGDPGEGGHQATSEMQGEERYDIWREDEVATHLAWRCMEVHGDAWGRFS